MKALSILGLIFGGLAPIITGLPFLLAPLGGEEFWMVGWAFFFFTVPLGVLLAVAGAALAIVAASLALRREVIAKAVPIVGICLIGTGLLLWLAGILGVVNGPQEVGIGALVVGIVCYVTGIIMSAVSGLRESRFPGARRIR